MKISKQKGTRDIYGKDLKIWQYIEENIREICNTYNVKEIRTPVFEATELYSRSVGDDTDIVNKEMYTFTDRGGRSITLRPELTAGVVRAYIENGFSSMTTPIKLWYEANMYRYEKMQKGRYREFTQFGVEFFGSESYLADIEVILLANTLFKKLNIADKVVLNINSIGCTTCRKEYIKALKDYVKPNLDSMCETCRTRYEKNPLRMLDCKEENCKKILKSAPELTEYLCEECKTDFENLKKMLTELDIKYIVDSRIVRGLDYYNKTVFEFVSKDLDLTVCAGGRYDRLVEYLGGNSTKAVGFGLGMDRLVLLLNELNILPELNDKVDAYILMQDSNAYKKCIDIVNKLRENGYIVEFDICNRSFNAQLKYANKINSKYVIIVGEEELKTNTCVIKNMEDSTQEKIELDYNLISKKIK